VESEPEATSNALPVVALTIISGGADSVGHVSKEMSMLVVVRDRRTNQTHPDVVSVPTQRIPRAVFEAIVESAVSTELCNMTLLYDSEEVDSRVINGNDPMVYAVESLLSRKLGVSNVLETGDLSFRAKLRGVRHGTSVHRLMNSGGALSEQIAMANVLVTITAGAARFVRRTKSYSHIRWVSIEKFIESVRKKDPIHLDLNPMKYCIHGLCISTAHDILTKECDDPALNAVMTGSAAS
jgi:hypothetical protein